MTHASGVEATLRAHALGGLNDVLPHEFVVPHYPAYSIGNLPATIGELLGAGLDGALPAIPDEHWRDLRDGVRCVLLVLLDAAGYSSFRSVWLGEKALEEWAVGARLMPLTSVFPSTTMAAMTTLWTGRAPASHGFVGSRLLLSELGVVANMVLLSPAAEEQPGQLLEWGWEPKDFVAAPGLAEQLAAKGGGDARTSLPRLCQRGSKPGLHAGRRACARVLRFG